MNPRPKALTVYWSVNFVRKNRIERFPIPNSKKDPIDVSKHDYRKDLNPLFSIPFPDIIRGTFIKERDFSLDIERIDKRSELINLGFSILSD